MEELRKSIIERLKVCQQNLDIEMAHSDADDLLCELLRELGCSDVVEAWDEVPKWYA